MPVTTGAPWNIPSPTLPEAPNAPQDMSEMAETVHDALGRAYPCLSSGRPSHEAGLIIYETDTDVLQVSDGTNWHALYVASNKPMGLLRRTTNQTIATSSLTGVVFTSADADTRGVTANTTTGKFEILTTGRYWVRSIIPFAAVNTTGYRAAVIRHNTAIIASDYRAPIAGTATFCNFGNTWPALMTAGDTVHVEVIHTAGVNNDIANSNANLEFGITWDGPG